MTFYSSPSLLTSCAYFVWALGLFFGLTEVVSFEYSSDSGIVSWVSKNRYPKKQEIFWFLSFSLVVPVMVYLGQRTHQGVLGKSKVWVQVLYSSVLMVPLYGLYRMDASKCLDLSIISILIYAILLSLIRFGFPERVAEGEVQDQLEECPPEFGLPQKKNLLFKLIRYSLLLILVPWWIYTTRYSPAISRWPDHFHEGEFLYPLYAFWNGDIPYRDIYLQHGFFHNLGVPYIAAQLFGLSIAAVRAMHVLIDPLGWIGAYFLICALTGFRFIPSLCFAYFCAMIHINVQERAFFGCCSLAMLAFYLQTDYQKKWVLILGGACSSLALLYSVEVGIYALASSFCVVFLLELLSYKEKIECRGRPAYQYLFGSFCILLPFFAYLAFHGGLGDFFKNILTQILYQSEFWGLPFPNILQMLERFKETPNGEFFEWLMSPRVSLIHGPITLSFLGLGLAHFLLSKGRSDSRNVLLTVLLYLTGLCFFRTNLGRSDGGHFAYGYMITLLVICYGADVFLRRGISCFRSRHWKTGIVCIAGTCGLLWLPWNWIEENTPKRFLEARERNKEKSLFPLKEAHEIMSSHHLWKIREFRNYIAQNTDETERIYDFSNQSAYLFFSERKSASPYFMPVYAVLKEHQDRVISDLDEHKVNYILFRSDRYFRNVDGFPTYERTPHLLEYIRKNFAHEIRVGGIDLWKRIPTTSTSVSNFEKS